MKKVLLASSALVGAFAVSSVALANDHLSISGYVQSTITVDTSSETSNGTMVTENDNDTASTTGAEIYFDSSRTSDSGLTYGTHIDWIVDSNSIDEMAVKLSGDWGSLSLGNDDGAVNVWTDGRGA